MSLAFLFPGQGAQKLGMMSGFANSSIVRQTFEEASDELSLDFWALLDGSDNASLNETKVTQPLLLTVAIAVFRAYLDLGGRLPEYAVGHSLGEYSALVAAQVLSFADAVKIVQKRAQFMQEAVPFGQGAMAAILGLEASLVSETCAEIQDQGIVEMANYNSPLQIVIAGESQAVQAAMSLAKQKGAKRAVLLPVSVPSHCSLMKTAADQLADTLTPLDFQSPRIKVIHNVDADYHQEPQAIKQALIQQLYSPVLWVDCITQLHTHQVVEAAECSPTHVLTDLNKRMPHALPVSAFMSLEHIQQWLEQHA